jgi:hypothetical protein
MVHARRWSCRATSRSTWCACPMCRHGTCALDHSQAH